MAEVGQMIVVDGNNVMGSRPDGWWKDRAGAARRLVEQLGAWAAQSGDDVLVVFDGPRPPEMPAPERVEVRFARRRGPDAADDDIAALVGAIRSRRSCSSSPPTPSSRAAFASTAPRSPARAGCSIRSEGRSDPLLRLRLWSALR